MNMKRILVSMCCMATLLAGCQGGSDSSKNSGVFAPDNIVPAGNGTLLVSNRSTNEMVVINTANDSLVKHMNFETPVNDMLVDGATVWTVTDGAKGMLCEVNPDDMSIVSQTPMGYTPSSIVKSDASGNLWITQRFNDQLWEVNPATKEVVAKIPVGREPVDMVTFAGDSMILVINNMPEGAANAYPICAKLDIVDASTKSVVKRIELPNGSTDVRNVATDSKKQYAYITHLLGRYQIPTNQVDRGWMMTNVMSIVDLGTQELLTTVMLDTPQKGAGNPHRIAVTDDDKVIGVAVSGTHEIAYIDREKLHDRIDRAKAGEKVVPSLNSFEDIPNDAGFLYAIREFVPTGGNGPRAIAASDGKLYAANYFTGEVVEFDPASKEISSASYGNALGQTELGEGEMYFSDAALCFQSWQSCASCHPNDARVDGLNWDLLNDGPGTLRNTKTLLYSHFTAPCMVTGIRKDAQTAVRSGMKYILFAQANEKISQAMDKWLMSLKALPSPYLVDGELSEAAVRGKVSFDKYCLSCHSGEYHTDQQQYDIPWTTGKDKGVKMDVTQLTEAWRTAPYLYDGRSYTMREMLDIHGPFEKLSDAELDDLSQYVLSL